MAEKVQKGKEVNYNILSEKFDREKNLEHISNWREIGKRGN